jgi:hypothetical protein
LTTGGFTVANSASWWPQTLPGPETAEMGR